MHFWEVIAELLGGSREGESGAGGLEWLEQWWEETMAKSWGLLEESGPVGRGTKI